MVTWDSRLYRLESPRLDLTISRSLANCRRFARQPADTKRDVGFRRTASPQPEEGGIPWPPPSVDIVPIAIVEPDRGKCA